jgi:hypothetical protein
MIHLDAQSTVMSGIKAATSATNLTSSMKLASVDTGADFNYLLTMATKESGLDSTAKASTSSATGAFQFIEQTWLGMVKSRGSDHGMANQASLIQTASNGRHFVPDTEDRAAILALRSDPQAASAMAGELTNDNEARLEKALDRPITDGELYIAHFFGAGAAIKFISQAETNPGAIASNFFPNEARANPGIFTSAETRPTNNTNDITQRTETVQRTMGAVLNTLVAGFSPKTQSAGPLPTPAAPPLGIANQSVHGRGSPPQTAYHPANNPLENNPLNALFANNFSSQNFGAMGDLGGSDGYRGLSSNTFMALLNMDSLGVPKGLASAA